MESTRSGSLLFLAALLLVALGPVVEADTGAEQLVLDAPYGTGIPLEELDGIIGVEWSDAAEYLVMLGEFKAVLRVKYDCQAFYVAASIHTGHEYPLGFEAYVVFDDGDDVLFGLGDDMMLAAASDGRLQEADYGYPQHYVYVPDSDLGGSNDAYGAGRFDSETGSYVFEFQRLLMPRDATDVPLGIGSGTMTVYGWASY